MAPSNQPNTTSPIFDLGVDYRPSTTTGNTLSVSDLDNLNVEFIRFTWVDFTNTIRFRLLPISYFKKLLESRRPGVSLAIASLGLVYVTLAEGFSGTGEYFLAPDLSSIRLCPYEIGHASVMGLIQEKKPAIKADGTTSFETPVCPRTALKRIVDGIKAEAGAEFLVGFESEFTLLKSDEPAAAVGTYQFSSSASLRTGAVATIVMDKIARAILLSGIELQMYHGEAGPGQYEVITGPLPPLEAADALIHTREIIYNTAAAHGLRATFAPRAILNGLGNGAHSHISVHSTRPGNEKSEKGMNKLESTFLAGVMTHLSSLPAFTLPIPASYKRVGDGVWSGGTYVCWGTENRECPVRLTNATSPTSRRFEMRFLDGTANPHLALAGILGAAALAFRSGYNLTLSDCSGAKTAAQMTEAERLQLGIHKRMPLTWEEGRANIASDQALKSVLGPELVETYLAVNKVVGATLEAGEDDSAKLTRLIELY